MSRKLRKLVLPAALALSALHVAAAPVQVQVQSYAVTWGSGFGVDANEQGGTLLGAAFFAMLPALPGSLLNAGDAVTFSLGSVQFDEPNAHGGILAGETDALGASATLTLGGAVPGSFAFTASMLAATGSVSDAGIDFSIDWSAPQQLAFGAGGLLEIALDDLSFAGPATKAQTATVTLLRAPDVATAIPEPGSLALFGLGLVGLGATRRRR